MVVAVHTAALACLDAAGKREQRHTEGDLHDDTWCTAFGDLLYRFPIICILDSVHDVILIWEATSLKLGEDKLPIDFDLKAAYKNKRENKVRSSACFQE